MTRKILEPGVSMIRECCDLYVRDSGEPPTRNELKELVKDADGILCLLSEKIDKEFFQWCPKIRVVSTYSVGFDHIDIEEATRRGVYVCYTPGVLTEATADFAWTLMMAAARRTVEADKCIRDGAWKTSWAPDMFLGHSVFGKTLGIIGFGRIGQAMAQRATGFKIEVLYYDPIRKPDLEKQLDVRYCEIEELLRTSDFVTIHVPRTKETTGLVNEKNLRLMKPTSVLVNTSRGGIVDERALYKALTEGWISAAGLDVFENEPTPLGNPLLKLRNIVIAPHIASATYEARSKMAEVAALNLISVLKGQEPPFLINKEVKNVRPLEQVRML